RRCSIGEAATRMSALSPSEWTGMAGPPRSIFRRTKSDGTCRQRTALTSQGALPGAWYSHLAKIVQGSFRWDTPLGPGPESVVKGTSFHEREMCSLFG